MKCTGISMTKTFCAALLTFAALFRTTPGWAQMTGNAEIPARPEQLQFPPLVYEAPRPAQYRVALKSGPVAYVVPDRERPLVNITIYVHTGGYVEPAGKEGLGGMAGYLLARGGTRSMSAEDLEERLAFLAANLNSSVSSTEGEVSLNLLSKDLDEGLKILREVLTEPRFQEDRLALSKQQSIQDMQQRNDDSESIEGREAGFLAFGEDFWANHYSTSNSITSITRADLQSFHQKWFHPDNFVVAVNGDFYRDAMVAKLETLFGNWPFKGEKPPSIPTNTSFAQPGVYLLDKDVNQGRVSIMLPGIKRDNPDYFSVLVMNDILGGGGFISHIMSSVRSDEGLAYEAYSSFPGGQYYPLTFTAGFQSKSRTVAYAASIVEKEIAKMRTNPPTAEELTISKRGYVDRFPHTFATKGQVANVFASDEFTGRFSHDPEFWAKFRDRIQAVTADDVLRVAQKYLLPEKEVVLIVGKKSEIENPLPDHPMALKDLGRGKVVDLPLRDPMTMKPLPQVTTTASKQ